MQSSRLRKFYQSGSEIKMSSRSATPSESIVAAIKELEKNSQKRHEELMQKNQDHHEEQLEALWGVLPDLTTRQQKKAEKIKRKRRCDAEKSEEHNLEIVEYKKLLLTAEASNDSDDGLRTGTDSDEDDDDEDNMVIIISRILF